MVTVERRSAAAAAIRVYRRQFIEQSGSLFCMQCQRAGSETTTIEIHHIIPVSAGGSDDDTNLVTLCSECHKVVHRLWPVREHGSLMIYGGPRTFLDLMFGLAVALGADDLTWAEKASNAA